MTKTILMLGTLDTKGTEHAYLRDRIREQGCNVLTMNVGVMDAVEDMADVDITAEEVAAAAETTIAALRDAGDRGTAMKAMGHGAAVLTQRLHSQQAFDGVIGMGGSGGSSVICQAMRSLPLGVPKVCVSTVAGSDTSHYLGTKDIVLIPAITDVAGVHRFSKVVFAQSAGAICGMVRAVAPPSTNDRPLIAASMFGNTTTCLNACRVELDAAGFEVLVFHAIGTGGRTMESLVDDNYCVACLDLTTTEWADELCGGVFSAGPDRLAAPGRVGIPHVVAPGCIDMVNFGPAATVPAKFRDAGRLLHEWNPNVTLLRTNVEENRQLGVIFAEKLSGARGPTVVLVPLRGYSILGGEGEIFHDPTADRAFLESLKAHIPPEVEIIEVDANINDQVFSRLAVQTTLRLLGTPI